MNELKNKIKIILNKLPYIKSLIKKINLFQNELAIYKTEYPPGHYYSPIINISEIQNNKTDIYRNISNEIPGIELNQEEQMRLLSKLKSLYSSIPFTFNKSNNLRYYYNNTFYSYSDAIFLQLIIRYFKPKRIIEIGSGFSSAAMLDTNDYFLNSSIDFVFIDPYPERLMSLLNEGDLSKHTIIYERLQCINLELFDSLEENDILFVDSTHVIKTGSDVNLILFDILPRLKNGVLIHFHDIFYPFEYLKEWVYNMNGFGWNEIYALRAFLMFNNEFRIIMFNTFMEHFYRDWFVHNMPDCLKNEGGSIWLQKNI